MSIFLAWGFGFLQARESERRHQTPANYRQAAEADARSACIAIEPARMFECVYEKVEASKEQSQTDQDLSAQQRAASAGLASAGVALLTLIVTIIGVWFIKRTLEATLQAVEDTGEATVAMQEANKIAREAMLDNSRPWLFVESISHNVSKWRHGLETFEWKYNVVNHGQSLAIVDHIEAGVCFSDVLPRDYWPYDPEPTNGLETALIRQPLNIQVKHSGSRILRPADFFEFDETSGPGMRMNNVPPELQEKRRLIHLWTAAAGPDWLGFWLVGKVRYRDARNRRLETGFCYRLSFKGPTAITEEGGDDYNYRT